MKRVFSFIRYVYYFWAVAWFLTAMLLLSPLLVLPILFAQKKGMKISFYAMKAWALVFTFPIGAIWFKTDKRLKHRDKSKAPVIYIANHNSLLDTPALTLALPKAAWFVGKASLSKVPVFGWIYRFLVLLVERGSVKAQQKLFDEMRRTLQQGLSLIIFPEGHINKNKDYGVQPFQMGAFKLSLEMNIPIEVLWVQGSKECLPAKGFPVAMGVIKVEYKGKLYPSDFQDIESYQLAAKQMMETKMKT